MNRRSLLGCLLAYTAGPAIVRSGVLMPVRVWQSARVLTASDLEWVATENIEWDGVWVRGICRLSGSTSGFGVLMPSSADAIAEGMRIILRDANAFFKLLS